MLECKIGDAESGHDRPVIVVGDFNQVTDSVLDRSNPSNIKKHRAVEILNNICKDLGLVDVWRLMNPTNKDCTFYHRVYTRIDYFLVFSFLLVYTASCDKDGSLIAVYYKEQALSYYQKSRLQCIKKIMLPQSLPQE